MNGPAFPTRPLAHVERLRLPDVSARRAALRGGEPPIYLHKGLAIPLGFVLKLAHDLAPTYVADRTSEASVLQWSSARFASLHVLHGQCLAHDQFVLFDDLRRELAGPIAALIGYLRMRFRHAAFLTLPGVARTIRSVPFLAQELLLLTAQTALALLEVARVAGLPPCRRHNHVG